MKYLISSLFLFFLCSNFALFSQSNDLTSLREEHSKYLAEIENAQNLLQSKSKSKLSALNEIKIINSKVISLQNLISSYNIELALIQSQLDKNSLLLDSLNNDIEVLRDNYARLIIEADRIHKSQTNELLLLFSSESFSEAYRRFQILKQYSSYRKKQGIQLQASISKYDSIVNQQQLILDEKTSSQEKLQLQIESLNSSKQNKNELIRGLSKDQNWLKAQISENIKKSKQLQNEIEKLISAESYSSANIEASDFKLFKGKLMWPLSNGIVTSTFGEHNHAVLKGVKIKNNGIDIATAKNSDVKCVFAGSVSRVVIIPGYNNAVIIRHGNYLTVYANLKDVAVKSGQKVSAGDTLGNIQTSSTDINAILHFEVWEGNSKTNPLTWLQKN